MRVLRNLKFRIYSFEVRCAALISSGLTEGKNKTQILRALKKLLRSFCGTIRLTPDQVNKLWEICLTTYSKISRSVWGKRRDPKKVYEAIRSVLPYLEHEKNELGRNIEELDKRAYLENLTRSGVFYISTVHTNCAEGHKDYQGKIYVDENWKDKCDDQLQKKVAAYIRNHKCMTIQEVVGDPVYLITRPNCRHRFVEIDVDEVLHSSVNKILKKHHLYREGANSYAYSQYRMYYERLKVLLALRETLTCDKLEDDIKKTRALIKKWLPLIWR